MKNVDQLKKELKELRENEPKLRSRKEAERLGISEAELQTLQLGENVHRLTTDFKELLLRIPEIGEVMALTRNETTVMELDGTYDSIAFKDNGHGLGTVENEEIGLRFFMNNWKYGLALRMEKPNKTLYSFQFFDENGTAVHKIYTRDDSNVNAYHAIKKDFIAEEQEPIRIEKNEDMPSGKSDSALENASAMRKAWMNLSHTHDFYFMLRNFGITRLAALENAPEGYAVKVENDAIESLLEEVVEKEVPIMTFVQNPACVEIQKGAIHNLKWVGDWYNVLDPIFNLHIDTDRLKQSWIVRKPTDYGIITSLEVYDVDDELALTFFGLRESGDTELPAWRKAVDTLLNPDVRHAQLKEPA